MEKRSENGAALESSRKIMDVVLEITRAVSNTYTLDELYRVIHTSLGKIFNAENFYIAIHHPERNSITFPYFVDTMDKMPGEIVGFNRTASLTGQVIAEKRPMLFTRDQIVNLAVEKKGTVIGTPSQIWLGAPLMIREDVIGVVAVHSYRAGDVYTETDLALLHLVARHIVLAIDRKRFEEELFQQREILKKILEVSPLGICLAEDRVFKWVNPEMVRMFGYDQKADLEGQSIRILYPSLEDYIRAGRRVEKDLKAVGRSDLDISMVKKDGTSFPVHLQISCRDINDPMAWSIITVTDMSLRKSMEKERIRREKLQGILELAGAVCHEMNQPLQTILGYCELIMMDISSDFESYKEFQNIKAQISRIGDITRRLSGITQYKTVKYPGDIKIFDIWNTGGPAD